MWKQNLQNPQNTSSKESDSAVETPQTATATTSASVTYPIRTPTDGYEIGADKTAADPSSVTVTDTSMQNSAKPKTPPPLPDSKMDDDEEQTDGYSDDEMILDTNIEPQSPVDNDIIIKTGNDTVTQQTIHISRI